MKTRYSINLMAHLSAIIGFSILLAMPLALRADEIPATATSAAAVNAANNMTMYLGDIPVHGQSVIIKTLQAIKVGLQMPYSNDPKLADAVVCRLEDDPSSHISKILICGTNRTLAKGRTEVQVALAIANSQPGPMIDEASLVDSCNCYTALFAPLNATLDTMPGHYLKTSVDGAALRKLLQKVPYPKGLDPKADKASEKAPEASTNTQ